ncbi:aminopeptidase [Halobacteriales archaeon Cl-PHB]
MDPRVERHAELLASHSTDIGPGDMVVVKAGRAAHDLVEAVCREVGERGGHPVRVGSVGKARRAFLKGADPEKVETPTHIIDLVESADVIIDIDGRYNQSETSDVDPEKLKELANIRQPLNEAIHHGDHRLCVTMHPAPGNAQKAEMSTAAFADFVYDAIDKDWEAQAAFQAHLVEILEAGSEVRIVAGEDTDLTMSINGNPALNDDGKRVA